MEGRTERLSSLEKDLQPPGRGQDLNIIVRTERSIRGPDDVMVRVPNETPFPDGFEVTFESIEPDGTCYRVWHERRDSDERAPGNVVDFPTGATASVPKTVPEGQLANADGKGSESEESNVPKLSPIQNASLPGEGPARATTRSAARNRGGRRGAQGRRPAPPLLATSRLKTAAF